MIKKNKKLWEIDYILMIIIVIYKIVCMYIKYDW